MIRAAVCILLSLLAVEVAQPAEPPPERVDRANSASRIVAVRVGFEGRYRVGVWTPVTVLLRGPVGPHAPELADARLTITVPDGDGVPSRVTPPLPSPAPALPDDVESATDDDLADGVFPVRAYVRFGRIKSPMKVELYSGKTLVAARTFQPSSSATADNFRPAQPSAQALIVTVGPGPMGVKEAVGLMQQLPEERTQVALVRRAGDLPHSWLGYEGVEAVVLSTKDPAVYAGLNPNGAVVRALDDWVRMGGKLVICGGRRGVEVLRGKALDDPSDGPATPIGVLADLVPGRVEGTVRLRRTSVLEAYCGGSQRVPSAEDGMPGILLSHLTEARGRIELSQGNVPIIVRSPREFGLIVYLAAGMDDSPLAKWPPRAKLMGRLLGTPTEPLEDTQQQGTLGRHGYDDLAGQMRSALDQFPDDRFSRVWPGPFSFVVGLIVLYLLAIGPGDYFLVHRLLGRAQLTWITFPAIVLVFSLAACAMAYWLKGKEIAVNQIDLVDVDVVSGRIRGTTWANLFSPRTERYDVVFQPRTRDGQSGASPDVVTSWLGLPGSALGGMSASVAGLDVWPDAYDFSQRLDAIEGVPLQIWSTKSLTSRWWARTSRFPHAQLVQEGQAPNGTITNTLGFPLTECLLVYGDWGYELGTIPPGGSVRVGATTRCRHLSGLLTERELVVDEKSKHRREQPKDYRRDSTDGAYILRSMMFYDAAGGRRYTGLAHSYQPFVDLSDLLRTDRAILIVMNADDAAGGKLPGADLLLSSGGRPIDEYKLRRQTVLRFILPVASQRE